jgi:hypothetical protein
MISELPPSRIRTSQEYHDACERLANASVAKHRADAEFAEAMRAFSAAQGAAKSQGIIV